jgi:hypothetical protein
VGEGRTGRDLDRITVAEAAEALGVSQDAVRKRIKRDTIAHDRDESGRVYVYLAPSKTVHKTDQDARQDDATKTVQDAYVRSLEDQIRFLREELERKDAILLNLTERIPQLEAAHTAEELPERAEPRSDDPGPQTATESPQTGDARRPWWRRWFGG